jgi:hypothetical protein
MQTRIKAMDLFRDLFYRTRLILYWVARKALNLPFMVAW